MTVVSVGISRHPYFIFMSALKPAHVEHKTLNLSASDYLLTCHTSFAFNRQMKWKILAQTASINPTFGSSYSSMLQKNCRILGPFSLSVNDSEVSELLVTSRDHERVRSIETLSSASRPRRKNTNKGVHYPSRCHCGVSVLLFFKVAVSWQKLLLSCHKQAAWQTWARYLRAQTWDLL